MSMIDNSIKGIISSLLDVTAFIGRGADMGGDSLYRPLEEAIARDIYLLTDDDSKDDDNQPTMVSWRDVEIAPGTSLSSMVAKHIAPRLSRITVADILDLLETTYLPESNDDTQQQQRSQNLLTATPARALERLVSIVAEAAERSSGRLITPPSPFVSSFAMRPAYAHRPGEHHSYELPRKL